VENRCEIKVPTTVHFMFPFLVYFMMLFKLHLLHNKRLLRINLDGYWTKLL